METEFLIDGMLSGTGIRNVVAGGYIDPCVLGLSALLGAEVADWQRRYEEAHFAAFPGELIDRLDEEGLELLSRARIELPDRSFGYFSNGHMKRLA